MILADRALSSIVTDLQDPTGAAVRCVADHRKLCAGDVWFAWPGKQVDPRSHLSDCAGLGLRALIAERAGLSADWLAQGQALSLPIYLVDDLAHQAGELAAALSGNTCGVPRLVAVTGTNGKTSVTRWIAQAMAHLQSPCAVVGTLGAGFVDGKFVSTGLTTPDAVSLQRVLADLRTQGAQVVALEASSIGLDQGRLAGCRFEVAAFTNLSRDHLDYHGDMQTYENAKQRLMAWPGLRSAVINMDDPAGERFLRTAQSHGAQLWQVATCADAFVDAVGFRVLISATHVAGGMRVQLAHQGQQASATVAVIGQFNLENLAVVAGVLLSFGFGLQSVADAMATVTAPPGRMQVVTSDAGPLVVVDYAHTPDALEKVLSALRPVAQARQGLLHCLFGCGGDRDPGKRPLMAAAAERAADRVVVSSDNPRSESPQAIARQIEAGFSHADAAHLELDRAIAIEQLIARAAAADVVLLAGKGHETGQIIGDRVIPFSDVEQAAQALSRWAPVQGASA